MRIGFYIKYDSNQLGQIVGEEKYAKSICKELVKLNGVASAQVFNPSILPSEKLDVMIHLNDTWPNSYAYKHVLYFQNFYHQGSDIVLRQLQQRGFDGYAFFSQRLLDLHLQSGYRGIFLPLAADTTIFQPMPQRPSHQFDVVYIGNDIKGKERTMRYLHPATQFNFGLFGYWNQPWNSMSSGELWSKLSKGPVTRKQSASIYSNAKIVLNYTSEDSIKWDAMNLRFFEVLACRSFLISDRVPSAKREFHDCMVFTDGGEDLTEKINYYLATPEERNEIAERGYQYVTKYATVQVRAQELFNYLLQILR
ncbi:hypothetical protein SDC9_11414 [bioreactor metagenome]|uniref:Spore protein YkvP/CgeB glycosyl transferase-like domain-containing protein n=1 Tax=bioreactor metagenome TaxID=1076179 RepID=A0A644TFW8_9ZZZZ|nr:glycosyltransferase [Negativicutes bacterium]